MLFVSLKWIGKGNPFSFIQITITPVVKNPDTKKDKSNMSKKSLILSKMTFRAFPISSIFL